MTLNSYFPSLLTYPRKFWPLSIAYFFFMISFNMIIPELDDFLTLLGGAKYLGWILSLFAIASLLVRPFSGKLTDIIGRIPVAVFGGIINLLAGLLYPLFYSVPYFLGLRFAHGISAGFTPTGLTAYVADIIPDNKRGEIMGVLGVFVSAGIAVGQPLGSFIANDFGVKTMFYTGSILALIALAIVCSFKETLEQKEKFKWTHLKISRYDLFDRDVVFPFWIMMSIAVIYGNLLTIIPDFSTYMGVKNQGLFFSYFVFFSMVVRFFMGKTSDDLGRIMILRIGAITMLAGLIGLSFVQTQTQFFAMGSFLGLGMGIISPTLLAFTFDLSKKENRGRASSTYFIALEAGIAIGAISAGYLYNQQEERMTWAVYGAIAAACITVILLFMTRRFNINRTV